MTPQFVGKPSPARAISALVKLPLRNAAELEELTRLQSDPQSLVYRKFLTVAQFRARYAPLPATMQQAILALRASGLQVTKAESQLLHVSAPAANIERAFGVHLGIARDTKGTLEVVADVAPTVSKGLAALNATVVGLNYQIAPRPLSRRVSAIGQNREAPNGTYWFDDLKQAYSYPTYAPFNGMGVTIATVGESDFSDSDAALYFNHELLGGPKSLAPAPTLARLLLGGAPFDPNTGISDEANVDVQQSGGSAPGATIVGVDVPSVPEGFLVGYAAIDELNFADIVSTSYGSCELTYLPAYNNGIDQTYILRAYHDLFLQGNSQGITFLFASGDEAGIACPQPGYFLLPNTGKIYKDLPGTSIWSDDPNVTSVGGTNLVTSYIKGKLTSTYVRENAYADRSLGPIDQFGFGNNISNALWGSGGGPSVIFKKPWYQDLVGVGSDMRTDPDVSMQMGGCPGYVNSEGEPIREECGKDDSSGLAFIGGQAFAFIGTSLSTPEFAGLLAVLEQAQGNVRFGNVNGYIYRLAHTNTMFGRPVFHQGIPGTNGVVQVAPGQLGYNQIVGVGTPISNNFLLLPYAPLAGDPQTPSNP